MTRFAFAFAVCGLVACGLVGCGASPRGAAPERPPAPSAGPGAGSEPAGSTPDAPKMSGKILAFERAKEHLRVDKVGSKDGDLAPDGVLDHVFELDLDGPTDALFVIATDDAGNANGDFAVDTLVGADPLPPSVAALGGLGKHTGGLGVFEGGALLSAADGHLPALAPGRHTLHLHLSGKDVPRAGGFRVFARFTDGSVVAGPSVSAR